MAKLKACKHCKQQIAKTCKICPHCGGKNKTGIGCGGLILFVVPFFTSLIWIYLHFYTVK